MNVDLNENEVRVLGCLMEKSVTTPDQYPLSLNALVNACNQKSSRDPVLTLDQGTVQHTVRQLGDNHLIATDDKSRVERYSQRFANTPFADLQFSDEEFAIVTVLVLRGPQTPGELRTRCNRLFAFEDNDTVSEHLEALMNREDGAVVARLARKSGRQDHEYAHLFSGPIESVAAEPTVAHASAGPSQASRLAELEDRVQALEADVRSLLANSPRDESAQPAEEP